MCKLIYFCNYWRCKKCKLSFFSVFFFYILPFVTKSLNGFSCTLSVTLFEPFTVYRKTLLVFIDLCISASLRPFDDIILIQSCITKYTAKVMCLMRYGYFDPFYTQHYSKQNGVLRHVSKIRRLNFVIIITSTLRPTLSAALRLPNPSL